MKRKIELGILLLVLVLLLAEAASAQGEDVVKFQEQSGELQGQICIVEPASSLLIAERNSIPYSFQVTPATAILIGNRKATMEDLAFRKGQSVSVKFRATRKGNIAQQVNVP